MYVNWPQLGRSKTKRFRFTKAEANLHAKKTSGGELRANLEQFFLRHLIYLLSSFFYKKQMLEISLLHTGNILNKVLIKSSIFGRKPDKSG